MARKKPPTVHRHQPRTQNRFRERELARAVRAAKSAGGERVEIDPVTGRISVVISKLPSEPKQGNPWLAEMEKKK